MKALPAACALALVFVWTWSASAAPQQGGQAASEVAAPPKAQQAAAATRKTTTPDGPRVRPADWAQPVIGSQIGNFFRVSDDLYRSEQPDKEDVKDLLALGIRSVLSLRQYHNDTSVAANSPLKLYHVEMDAANLKPEELKAALALIRQADKPLLVHCWHGSDRTGVVVALYRMVFQAWSREKAIDEFMNGGYGYHKTAFPGILEFLKTANPEDFK